MTQTDPAEVRMWVERLRTSKTDQEAAEAASRLSYVRVRTRGSVRTRGAVSRAAESEFPEEVRQEAMQVALRALQERAEVRREVAFALGQWADEKAVGILVQILKADPDEGVRRACVDALRTIAGVQAVNALRLAAERDCSEQVRYDAIAALAELASTEQPLPRASRAVRTRGAVKPRLNLTPEGRQILDTLVRIADNTAEPEYIRRSARAAITPLEE